MKTNTRNSCNGKSYLFNEIDGFEIRYKVLKDYNFTKDDKFEIRITHRDSDVSFAMLEKVLGILNNPLKKICDDCKILEIKE